MSKRVYFLFLSLMFFVFMSCTSKNKLVQENIEGKKIVSLAPSNTEILVELGVGNNIVGVDEYSSTVEGVLENIEVFKFGEPSIEALGKLQPDIIFAVGNEDQMAKFDQLKKMGVEVVNIETADSIEEIYDSIKLIGEKIDKSQKANEVVESLKSKVKEVENQKLKEPVRVYFEISQAPYLYSFGKNTYLNEMIEIVGGENIFKDIEGWNAPSEEAVIKANPQVIFTNVNLDGSIDEIKNRKAWENIDAIKNNRVFLIDENSSSRPSQLFMNALYEMQGYLKESFDEK